MNLIVPLAGEDNCHSEVIPYLYLPDKDGILLCVKSILGLNYKEFENIIFTILEDHNKKYYLEDTLKIQFRRLGITNAKIITLKERTRNQAETIFKTITQTHIKGCIFIKDADSFFMGNVKPGNSISIISLEDLSIIEPRNKSYVSIDEMHYVTNIIEKRIISKYFSAGGYCFQSVDDFCKYYNELSHYKNLYISHIIYSMLLDKINFKPLFVNNYVDWGTIELRKLYLSRTYAQN